MKSKSCLLFWLIAFISINSYAQQAYKIRYVFKRDKFSNNNLQILEKTKKNTDKQNGYLLLNGKKEPIYSTQESEEITGKSKKIHGKKLLGKSWGLYGRITDRSEDTLFIRFWNITKATDPKATDDSFINYKDNGKEFIYKIAPEEWKNGRSFIIPYSYRILTATNLPFRIKLSSGDLEAEFLNFNVAHIWVNGRTKIFKNDYIEPRNSHFGFGPFVGLTSIEDKSDESTKFGVSAGLTGLVAVANLNIVGAVGVENGFTRETNSVVPYIGIGLGFKLVDLFDPEFKKDD